jgi:hypothetical protein
MSYLSIIQKDLPLATWGLDEAPGSSAVSDTFINSPGTYYGTQSVKSIPFVYGSDKSIVLVTNGAEANPYCLKIPSLDRLSEKTKRNGFAIEFWIKFIDEDFSGPENKTKIMGKLGHEHTGVYIHNSSIIGVIGDTSGSFVSTDISLPNMSKPMHIVLAYQNNSVSLFVNGQMSIKTGDENFIKNSYNSDNEFFTFYALGSPLTYAIDNVAIYSKSLDLQTVRRHLAYGFGYEFPNRVANSLGGIRYPLSMSDTKPASFYQQYWSNPETINNLVVEKGYLTIRNITQPQLKFASDKDISIFEHTSNGLLMSTAGGYVEIDSPVSLAGSASHGFGFSMHKSSGSSRQTLLFVSDKYDYSKFFEVYIGSDNKLYSSYSDGSPTTLINSTVTGTFSFGYYYSVDNKSLTIFSGSTSQVVPNIQITPDSIRLLSSPLFSERDVYDSSDDPATGVSIKKVFNIKSATITGTELNEYVATHLNSEKRFVMSASGQYVFNIDLKKISGANDIVGNNYVSWGYDGSEVEFSVSGNFDDYSETLVNRSSIPNLALVESGANKFITVTADFSATDIEFSPPKVYYFRIYTYETEDLSETDTDKTIIYSDGPDIVIDLDCVVPSQEETPFFYNEEKGGLYVGGEAYIDYDSAPISADTAEDGKIGSISFFINPSSTSSDILSIDTIDITYSSSTLSGSGVTFYVNGNAGTSLVNGQWNHVSAVFTTAIAIPERIIFGGTTSGFYLDEIIVFGKKLTSTEANRVFEMYKGVSSEMVGSSSVNISIIDTETTSSGVLYQPIGSVSVSDERKIKSYSVSTDNPIYVDAYSSNET